MFAARSIVGILLLFLLSFTSFLVADSRSDTRLRLLSVKQGEAIVQAAWELRRGLNPKPDCSHFVHAVYAKAGFPYEYAATREVFTGIDGFRRVQKPQPGDLVVWQGHIGIVIDPGEHSFYSSVLSGFAIENYQSPYWVTRGNPRFYRFVVNDLQKAPGMMTMPLRASATQVHPSSKVDPASNVHPSNVHPSNQAPLLETQRSPESSPSPRQKPGVVATVAGSRNQPLLRPGTNQKPVSTVADSTKGASRQPAQIAAQPPVQVKLEAQSKLEAGAGKIAGQDAAIPNEVNEIFVTSHATPYRPEVLAAIRWWVNDNGERLLRDRLLDSKPSVGVAGDFRLVSLDVDVQSKTGLAEVEFKQIAAFRYGKPASNRLISTQHVILSRQEQGWVLINPQDLMYLNRHMAAMALTNQLATLSKAPADQLQARKTTKILHELVLAKNAGVKTAGALAGGSN